MFFRKLGFHLPALLLLSFSGTGVTGAAVALADPGFSVELNTREFAVMESSIAVSCPQAGTTAPFPFRAELVGEGQLDRVYEMTLGFDQEREVQAWIVAHGARACVIRIGLGGMDEADHRYERREFSLRLDQPSGVQESGDHKMKLISQVTFSDTGQLEASLFLNYHRPGPQGFHHIRWIGGTHCLRRHERHRGCHPHVHTYVIGIHEGANHGPTAKPAHHSNAHAHPHAH